MASWRRAVERLQMRWTVRTGIEGLCLALDSPSRPVSAFEKAFAEAPLLTGELLPIPTALVRAHLVHLSAGPRRSGRLLTFFLCSLDTRASLLASEKQGHRSPSTGL